MSALDDDSRLRKLEEQVAALQKQLTALESQLGPKVMQALKDAGLLAT